MERNKDEKRQISCNKVNRTHTEEENRNYIFVWKQKQFEEEEMSHPQKSHRNTDSMGPDVLNTMESSESGREGS